MYLWLKALHILMVVVWLGTDIGTFASFNRVLDTTLSVPTRLSMSRLSNLLDQGPRSALVILLMLGLTMTQQGGWGLAGDAGRLLSVAATLIGIVWFAGIWHQYWVNHPPLGVVRSPAHVTATSRFRTVDLWWRIGVASALLATAVYSLSKHNAAPISANWLSWKLVLFAGIVADGVLIRLLLPKLGGAIVAIATKGSSAEREADLARHGRTAKIYVLIIWGFLIAVSALAVMKPSADVHLYGVVKTLHVLSIATWFGVDLGVFLCAKLSLDRKLSAESRAQFARLFSQLDLGPRISLLVTVPMGVTLTHLRWGWLNGRSGVKVGGVALAVFVVAWVVLVVRQHSLPAPYDRMFAKVDAGLRIALVAAMVAFAAATIHDNLWIGLKAIFFAVMVLCGLYIRYGLKDFGPAFAATQKDDASTEVFVSAQNIMKSVYTPVFLIWALLIVSIVLATVKPT